MHLTGLERASEICTDGDDDRGERNMFLVARQVGQATLGCRIANYDEAVSLQIGRRGGTGGGAEYGIENVSRYRLVAKFSDADMIFEQLDDLAGLQHCHLPGDT
jgi:hypothetical protein